MAANGEEVDQKIKHLEEFRHEKILTEKLESYAKSYVDEQLTKHAEKYKVVAGVAGFFGTVILLILGAAGWNEVPKIAAEAANKKITEITGSDVSEKVKAIEKLKEQADEELKGIKTNRESIVSALKNDTGFKEQLRGTAGKDANEDNIKNAVIVALIQDERFKGQPGKDADTDEIINKLKSNSDFIAKLQGSPGKDGVSGKDGAPGKDADNQKIVDELSASLAKNDDFIKKVAELVKK